jgi:hypothetical protein
LGQGEAIHTAGAFNDRAYNFADFFSFNKFQIVESHMSGAGGSLAFVGQGKESALSPAETKPRCDKKL